MIVKASILFSVVCVVLLGFNVAPWAQKPPEVKTEEPEAAVPGWDPAAQEVTITSSYDGTPCKAIFYSPDTSEKVPLLVALHTWAQNYGWASGNAYLLECKPPRGWAMIHPDFRGPNDDPKACASPEAIQDVLDAVSYACDHANIDRTKIYLAGFSGGGHMALMMAAKHPEVWAAVSAWAGITELDQWYAQLPSDPAEFLYRYRGNLEAICGGPPEGDFLAQYRERSPLLYLEGAKGLPLDIEVGVRDGVVPASHSMKAFNRVATANGFESKAFTEDEIAQTVAQKAVPDSMLQNNEPLDQTGRTKQALFMRTAGPVRIVIHEGMHELENNVAVNWLSQWEKENPAASVMECR